MKITLQKLQVIDVHVNKRAAQRAINFLVRKWFLIALAVCWLGLYKVNFTNIFYFAKIKYF